MLKVHKYDTDTGNNSDDDNLPQAIITLLIYWWSNDNKSINYDDENETSTKFFSDECNALKIDMRNHQLRSILPG